LTLRRASPILPRVIDRRMILVSAGLLLSLTFFLNGVQRARADNPDCGLLLDCTMDGFYGDAGAGSGAWKTFTVSGTARFDLAPVEGWPKGPSVHLRGNNTPFDAGIFQTVAVTPGVGYHFDLAWAVEQVDGKGWQSWYQVNRRLGIDPYGGKDANSPNVQWSPDYLGSGKFVLALDGYAQGPTMTVFIRVNNPYTDHVVDVYLDTASLKENTGMPPIAVNAPTATQPPPPPTNPVPTNPVPTNPLPTARLISIPTQVAEGATETQVPTEVAAPSETLEPSETPLSSETSTRFPTRVRRPTPTPVVEQGTFTRTQALVLVGAAGTVAIVVAGAFFILAFVYWLRSRR
jgi:hypothetical protein